MRRRPGVIPAVAGLALISGLVAGADRAGAAEQHCKIYPEAGLLAESHEIVGEDACKAECAAVAGCTAWSYTPHTFRPTDGPGWCRLMAEVGEETADKRDYCGRM